MDRYKQPFHTGGRQYQLFWRVGPNARWKYWNNPTELKRRETLRLRHAKAALLHRVNQVDTLNDLP